MLYGQEKKIMETKNCAISAELQRRTKGWKERIKIIIKLGRLFSNFLSSIFLHYKVVAFFYFSNFCTIGKHRKTLRIFFYPQHFILTAHPFLFALLFSTFNLSHFHSHSQITQCWKKKKIPSQWMGWVWETKRFS